MPGRVSARALLWIFALAGVAAPVLPLVGLALGLVDGDGRAAPPLARLGPLVGRTALLALVVSALAVPLGALLACLEARAEYRGRAWLAVSSKLPLALPSYVLAGTLREALGPGGVIGRPLGLPSFTGFGAATFVLVLTTAPLAHLVVGAALARIPAAEEEAARTLGASPWAVRRAVLLPRLRPALASAALLVQLYVLADFGAVAVVDCQVLTWRIYQAVGLQRLDDAAVLAGLLLALMAPLLVGARLLHGRAVGAGVANPRPAPRRPLGPGGVALAWAAHALVAGLGCALPVGTLVMWVKEGLELGERFAPLLQPTLITLAVAGAGAALAVALAFAPAWLAARAGARAFDVVVLVAHALPGVLVGFGLLRLALAAPSAASYRALGESGALLLLGYAARFLPEAFVALRTAALAVDPRHDEAARTLGAGALRRLRHVTLPAMVPGAAAAFGLVVASIVKELPVTLLLGAACGARTLAFRAYDRLEEAMLHDAGAAGLLLVLVSLGGFALGARWSRDA